MLQTFIHRARQLWNPLPDTATDVVDIDGMTAVKNKPVEDNSALESETRYFVSCYRKLGVFGWIYYSKTKPVRLEEFTSERDVAYLMDSRRDDEPHCFIDTPRNLIGRLGCFSPKDFSHANTTTVELLRAQEATRFIETFVEALPHPETVFLVWLRAQISNGLTELCGVILQDHEVTVGDANSKLNRSTTLKRRMCEPEGFLRYYQKALIANYEAMPKIPDLVCIGGWRAPTLAELARSLLKQQCSGYLGLTEIMLQNPTAKLLLAERDARALELS